MKSFRIPALCTVLLAAGCAAPTCDPSQGGLIAGVNGLVSHCYANDAAAQQAQLQQLQAAQAQAQAEAQAANQTETQQQQQLTALQQNVALLAGRLRGLRAELQGLRHQNGTTAANVSDLNNETALQSQQLATLQKKLATSTSPATYQQTQQQYESLKHAIAAESTQIQQVEGE